MAAKKAAGAGEVLLPLSGGLQMWRGHRHQPRSPPTSPASRNSCLCVGTLLWTGPRACKHVLHGSLYLPAVGKQNPPMNPSSHNTGQCGQLTLPTSQPEGAAPRSAQHPCSTSCLDPQRCHYCPVCVQMKFFEGPRVHSGARGMLGTGRGAEETKLSWGFRRALSRSGRQGEEAVGAMRPTVRDCQF